MMAAVSPWLNRQLCYVFIGALFLFSVLRWDMTDWLEVKLDNALVKHHVPLHYQTLEIGGAGVEMVQVSIQIPSMPKPLLLDTVQLGINWNALWGGGVSFDVQMRNEFLQWKALLALRDDKLIINDIDAGVNVKAIQVWAEQDGLFQAAGVLTLQGDIEVVQATGGVASVRLNVFWKDAVIHVLNQDYALGDYHMHVDANHWDIDGGEQLQVSGKGELSESSAPIQQWPVQGDIELRGKGKLSALLPLNPLFVHITGTLGHPRW